MIVMLALASAVVPAGQTFRCTAVSVWDGDGPVRCAEGPKIRIAGIAAREMDSTCRSNQPCPVALAVEARDALVGLLGGRSGTLPTGHVSVRPLRLGCVSHGSAGGDRTAASCTLPGGRDLACAMVATGTALVWPRYWRAVPCPPAARLPTGRRRAS